MHKKIIKRERNYPVCATPNFKTCYLTLIENDTLKLILVNLSVRNSSYQVKRLYDLGANGKLDKVKYVKCILQIPRKQQTSGMV